MHATPWQPMHRPGKPMHPQQRLAKPAWQLRDAPYIWMLCTTPPSPHPCQRQQRPACERAGAPASFSRSTQL